jgi:hypothetical protein
VLVALRADAQPIRHLLLAEEALRLDDFMRAGAELDGLRSTMAGSSPRLKARFERASALVSIRTDGQWPLWTASAAGNHFLEREAIKREALALLRRRAAEAPEDPIRATDLGVALFAFPDQHGEARQILEKLAARDLMTAARGYYALSRLRSAVADQKGAGAALATCRKLDPRGKACGAQPPGKV